VSLNPGYVIIVLVLGVLFFGKNLPAVAKQIGSALLEFRRGLNEWKEEYGRSPSVGKSRETVVKEEKEERFEGLGTKFEPPSESG
jgi:Sec-independent protein translocase protein TatA